MDWTELGVLSHIGSVLSQYALEIGFALAALIAALAAWIISRGRQRLREEEGSYPSEVVQQDLTDLRRELQQLVAVSHATTNRAVSLSEKVTAAIEPIAAALRDFNVRISELERGGDANEKAMAEQTSREREDVLSQETDAAEQINARLKPLEQQLTVVSDRLSSLGRMMDTLAARDEEDVGRLSTVDARLAAIQGDLQQLSRRLDLVEENASPASAPVALVSDNVARLEATVDQVTQRLADLERRFTSVSGSTEPIRNDPQVYPQQHPQGRGP